MILVYVLHRSGRPLMPCSPKKARILLKEGKAKVIKRKPFTIQLLYGSSSYVQSITLGVDSGYLNIGLSAVGEKRELFSAEVKLRDDIKELNDSRRMYRKTRRSRLWNRPARFNNRKKPEGWLAPSIQHKLNTHIRVIESVKSILPICKIVIETAKFDIQKIKNSDIEGKEYQGAQKDFHNTKAYILHRDKYQCQICNRKDSLEVHHIIARKDQGTNTPENLITLCKNCHKNVTNGTLEFTKDVKNFKPKTFMNILRKRLLAKFNAAETFGYLTHFKEVN